MAINPGVYPLVPGTPVGNFRLATGDTQSVPLDPVVSGQQSYTYNSDAEITAYLTMGGQNINRGIGYYYLSMSGTAAMQARSIKDYDLSINTEKRAEGLRQTAAYYFGLADAEDVLAGSEDYFNVTHTGTDEFSGMEYFPYIYPVEYGYSDPSGELAALKARLDSLATVVVVPEGEEVPPGTPPGTLIIEPIEP